MVVFDRFDKRDQLNTEFYLGDVQDKVAVTEFVAHVDGVISLAGTLGTAETIKNPIPAVKTNILGGLNTLEACTQYDVPLVQIAVGNYFEFSTYSISKTTVERFCTMYRRFRDARVTVVRAMNAWGPGQSVAAPYGNSKVRKFLPSIICRALSNDDIELYGDGEQLMDFIHCIDLADTLIDSLIYTDSVGSIEHVLEVGTGRNTTINYVTDVVLSQIPETKSKVVYKPMRLGETPNSVVVADPTTLEVLRDGYSSEFIQIEEGIGDTVEYFRKYMERI